jgi:hypothetical protein
MKVVKQWLIVSATGYILMFFSEFIFYGEIAAESSSNNVPTLPDILFLYCIYVILSYIILALIRKYQVRSLWALFLVGAVYGWLLEGVVVTTMYEGFPLQVHFTGIAWHAPLDILVGWYLVQKMLRSKNLMAMFSVAGSLGLFWGLWVIWRWYEEGVAVPIERFTALALIGTLLLIVAYWLLAHHQPVFQANKWVSLLFAILLSLWFVGAVLPVYPFAVFVLPPLLFVIYLALRRNKTTEALPDLLATWDDKPGKLNLAFLLLIPIIAIGSYSLYLEADFLIPMSAIGYTIFSIVGIVLFIISIIKCLNKAPQAEGLGG